MIHASIPGAPVGKGRPRVTTRGGFARAYTPKKTESWEAGAAMVFRSAWAGKPPTGDLVRVVIEAVAGRPKSLVPKALGGTGPARLLVEGIGRRWRPTKPDADNVLKAVLDALVMAGVLRDDVQAVEVTARSWYVALDEGPSVDVTVTLIQTAGA